MQFFCIEDSLEFDYLSAFINVEARIRSNARTEYLTRVRRIRCPFADVAECAREDVFLFTL